MEVALTILCICYLICTCTAELKAEPHMHGYYRGLLYNTTLLPFQFYRYQPMSDRSRSGFSHTHHFTSPRSLLNKVKNNCPHFHTCLCKKVLTSNYLLGGNAVCVGCYQRQNIEPHFIMPMDNMAHCAHYGMKTLFTLILDGFTH